MRKMPDMVTEARFVCAECGAVAGTLRLIPQGLEHEEALHYAQAAGTLVIDYFFCRLREVVLSGGYAEVRRAIAQGDAEALYAVDKLWAPFYCPTCRRVYCGKHWTLMVEYEEGAWYDCTHGVCPYGHRRMIDD